MEHTNWTGTHLEAGRRQGERLRVRALPLPEMPPERFAYAAACVPVYERDAPELMDELRGLAEGAGVPFDTMAAFLLGMYAFPAGNRCTCFAVDTGEDMIFGRNSDFMAVLEPYCEHCRYTLTGSCALVGNTTAFCELEDGVNEYGLAVGLTYVYPTIRKPGWNAGYLVRYLLERCKTVSEALGCLRRLDIGSSQTLTLADTSGALAVAECNAESLVIRRPERGAVAAVNDFRAPEMQRFRCVIDDDVKSGLRWQTVTRALRENRVRTLADACGLLAGQYGFLCQYDRAGGFDTVWSTACALRTRKLLLCEGNPSRCSFTEAQMP